MAMARFSFGVLAIRYVLLFLDDIMFFSNGPDSGINFATKDRFRLNLLIYGNVKQKFHFIVLKGIIFYKLFRNYSQTEVKE